MPAHKTNRNAHLQALWKKLEEKSKHTCIFIWTTLAHISSVPSYREKTHIFCDRILSHLQKKSRFKKFGKEKKSNQNKLKCQLASKMEKLEEKSKKHLHVLQWWTTLAHTSSVLSYREKHQCSASRAKESRFKKFKYETEMPTCKQDGKKWKKKQNTLACMHIPYRKSKWHHKCKFTWSYLYLWNFQYICRRVMEITITFLLYSCISTFI